MNNSANTGKISGIRPFLKKIVPGSVRYSGKNIYIRRITRKIEKLKLLPCEPERYPWGVNLIGPLESPTGLGQSFRLLAEMFELSEIPYQVYSYDPDEDPAIKERFQASEFQENLRYSVNLWHVNPSCFAQTFSLVGRESFDGRYNIAYWLWELEEFPQEWVPYINLLDEVWTPSEFISNAIRRKTAKTVRTLPYYVTAPVSDADCDRAFFKLPGNRFLFLMMYDARSIRERKNPEGVIRAFQKAFAADNTKAGLVIKVNYADSGEKRWLKDMIGEYRNIYLFYKNLEKSQVNSLISCMDAVVSLHRAEGFGLVMAEAMLNHVPVIATGWSANTEFMDSSSACMVGYTLKKLNKTIFSYKKGSVWAEPDIDEAADYMKRLSCDRKFYREKAEKGCQKVKERLGEEATVHKMKMDLEEIRRSIYFS